MRLQRAKTDRENCEACEQCKWKAELALRGCTEDTNWATRGRQKPAEERMKLKLAVDVLLSREKAGGWVTVVVYVDNEQKEKAKAGKMA